MTELIITPKVQDKTARFKGVIAAGEHVAVTIKGGAEWIGEDDGANLVLRVIDLTTKRTLAVFPRPAETLAEGETFAEGENEWDSDDADLTCTLNLNTVRMVNAARHMIRVPVLFVLGDTDNPRTLYFRDQYEVEYWPERIGDDAPYDLDKWPKQIDDWTALVAEWQSQMAAFNTTLTGHVGNNNIHVTAGQKAEWNAKQSAISDLETIRAGAAKGATALQEHQDISGKADKSEMSVTPGTGANADKTTIQLKSGTSATVLTAHQDISGKADKSITYTKTEVDSLVSATGGKFIIVAELPSAATADPKAIYLVPRSPGETNNIYDEYLRVSPPSGTYAWEKIGSTEIDLSNRVRTDDPRLSDARAPTAHASTHASGGSDALSPAAIGAQPAGEYATAAQGAKADAALSRAEVEAGFTEWTVQGAYGNGADILGLSVVWRGGAWTVLHNGDTTEPLLDVSGQDAMRKSWNVESGDSLPEGWACVEISRTRLPTMADIPTNPEDIGAQSALGYAPVPVLESLTHAQLKAKRDAGALVPGASYRITDYVATTNGNKSSRSANHPFDLIVTADAANMLNEHARAIRHEGDTYFPNTAKFEAWQVWYSIDNDTSRFAWAVADDATGVFDGTAPFTGGRGIIYRMMDEFSNDVPYDFKGLQFLAYGDSDNVYRYTFDSGDASDNRDCSLPLGNSIRQDCNNVIARDHHNSYVWRLNRIVFKGDVALNNVFGPFCYDMTFGSACYDNEFGAYCYENYFGSGCSNNRLGSLCHGNTFVKNCTDIALEQNCYNNRFCDGAFAYGDDCDSISLGDGCHGNVISRFCRDVSLGAGSYSNTIKAYSTDITLLDGARTNTIGPYADGILIGGGVWDIRFGHPTSSDGGTFSSKSYYRNITVESGNWRIYLDATGTTSSSQYYRNVTIRHGTHMETPWLTISDPNVGQTFCTTYKPKDSREISI